jgi:hypothetical protein
VPTNNFQSPLYPGAWPPSAEKLAETKFMPPKQERQPEVGEDPASMPPALHHQPATTGGQAPADTTQKHPEWMAYLLDQMKIEIDNAIESKVVPRLDVLKGNTKSRPASPEPEYVQSPTPQPYAKPSQAPQSFAPQSVGSADFQQQRQYDDTHRKPRFRPESLPIVRFGDDVATWVAVMDHIILQHGDEIVCPEFFAHCFQSGDAMQLWYMDNDSLWKKVVTTKPGCWDRFKAFIEQRFSVDVGRRQIEAEDRTRYPNESYANFAIQKMYLIRRAFEHLAPSAIIAMVKRKLDWEAAQFCRERKDVNNFISELMEFDNLRAMQAMRQPPARGAQRGQASPYVPSTGSQSYKQQAQFPQPASYPQPVQYQQPAQYLQRTQYQQRPATAPPAPATGGTAFADPRLPKVQLRKHPQTGVDALSYLDRFGKTVFIQRPCGHCTTAGKPNTWHFEFSCPNKPTAPKRARTYAGMTDLPGTFESPSGLPTSYTFNGQAIDPDPEENPFSIDDCDESGNGGWDQ